MDIPRIRRLRREELPADTVTLARYLIGKILVRENPGSAANPRIAGRIVETEAYVIGDPSGHGFRGVTPANRSLFLRRGHAYVYYIYGSCFCMNISSEWPGIGTGVLLRALEPIAGIAYMQRRRGTQRLLDLTRGPGRLAAALGIDRRYDGLDLCARGPLWLGVTSQLPGAIGDSVRIGLSREKERVLRFYERGNPFVSGPRRLRV
jgi:DNA-3-methyladenine glycosylase